MKAPVPIACLLTLLTLAGCAWGSPSAGAPTAAQGGPASPIEVAITVDDLPAHGPLIPGVDRLSIAERFLAVFRQHAVPPVFGFVNGKKVDDDPATEAVLRAWIRAGNHLGNHTYSHVSLNTSSIPEYLADLERGEAILTKLDPRASTPRLFRYPFLFEGDTPEKRAAVRAYLGEHHYTIAEVSIDADDWAFNPPFARCAGRDDHAAAQLALRREYVAVHVEELQRMRDVTRRLAGHEVRQILLLHIGVADADALDDLLSAYEREGVRWITLESALADPFYSIDPNLPAKYGAAFPYVVAKARGVQVAPAIFARGLEERLDQVCR